MNPMMSAAVGSIVRFVLAAGAGYLVEHGIWSQSEAGLYVTAATMAVLSLAWSLWQKYKGRIRFLTALTLDAGVTEQDVKASLSAGMLRPSVTTPEHEVPRATV